MNEASDFLALQRGGNTFQSLGSLIGRSGEGDVRLELNVHLFTPHGQESQHRIQQEAAAQFDRMSEASERELAAISYNLGCFALFQDDIFAAKIRFAEAVRLRPDYSEALHNLAVAHELMADFDEARAELNRALELDPENGLSRLNLALIYREEGDTEEALRLLREQVRAHPGNMGLLYHLCRTLLARRAAEDAREVRELIEESPGWERVTAIRECLGQALLQLGELAEAEQLFREILGEGPPRPFSRIGLIKVLSAQERFVEVLEQAKLAEAEAPSAEMQQIIEMIQAL